MPTSYEVLDRAGRIVARGEFAATATAMLDALTAGVDITLTTLRPVAGVIARCAYCGATHPAACVCAVSR